MNLLQKALANYLKESGWKQERNPFFFTKGERKIEIDFYTVYFRRETSNSTLITTTNIYSILSEEAELLNFFIEN